MNRCCSLVVTTLLMLASPHSPIFADPAGKSVDSLSSGQQGSEANDHRNSESKSIQPFTGKITRNKVRLRLQPSLDALIIDELNKDVLVSVVGEADEFYSVRPLKETKGYVFRTFVLDGVIEGDKVNVRLEPALESPVIAQLNTGDKIEGCVSALNSKWYEIVPPESTRFYICKEYVEKIGSAALLQELEMRTDEVNHLLKTAYLDGKRELQKSFPNIRWEGVVDKFNKLINEYSDFPAQSSRAKELLAELQKSYLQIKVAYLEAQVTAVSSHAKEDAHESFLSLQEHKAPHNSSESYDEMMLASASSTEEQLWANAFNPEAMTAKMATWIQAEKKLYDQWAVAESSPSPYQFYQQQAVDGVRLQGMLEPYSRTVRNKPGDYLLVNQATNLPIAYLYSTQVNMQEKVGQEVTVRAVARPNNNFAFPAYYVLAVE